MADRRRQVELLLASRFDGLPGPTVPKPTLSGLAPARVEPCGVCGGSGRVRDRFDRLMECGRCRGRGRLAFDPMDALRVAVGSEGTVSSARPRKTVRCDSCAGEGAFGNGHRCEVCGGAGKRDLHAFEIRVEGSDAPADVIDRWQKALEVRNAAGSYEALERALAGIRVHVNKPERFVLLTANATQALRLLDEVFLPPAGRVFDELGVWEQRLVGLAIEYVESRMPDPIRVPADVRLNARELVEHRKRVKGRSVSNGAVRVRDEEIRRLVRRDVPVQRVAFDFGLSVSQVNRIVAGDEAA